MNGAIGVINVKQLTLLELFLNFNYKNNNKFKESLSQSKDLVAIEFLNSCTKEKRNLKQSIIWVENN